MTKNIYVRGVPLDVYRQFKSRAALEGLMIPEAAIKLFAEYGKRNGAPIEQKKAN